MLIVRKIWQADDSITGSWKLIERLLMAGNFEKALREARRWQRQREPIGYLMEAHIRSYLEDYEGVLDALRKGVQRHPHAWYLWYETADLLLKIQQRPEEAERALDRALECPNSPVDVILFAKAEAYVLCRRFEEALQVAAESIPVVERVPAPLQPVEWFDVLCACAHTELGNYDAAREHLTRLEKKLPQYTHEDKQTLQASTLTEWARLIWRETGDRAAAEQYAYRAFQTYPFLIPNLQLLYDMRQNDPCKPKNVYYISVFSVLETPGSEVKSFRYNDYLVIAENGRHAKSIVEPFESDALSVIMHQPRIVSTVKQYREQFPERRSHCGVIAVRPGGFTD
ncbi:MAG: hypothetical protein NZM28_08220 [Fimbriimonadales bacterium]|nr:hypothetical protein [Fimbriimonadales bacterium]